MPLLTPADAVLLPWHFSASRSNAWNLIDGVVSSTGSLSGAQQFLSAPGGGLWGCELRGIDLSSPDLHPVSGDGARMFRGIKGALKNGVMPAVVYRNDAMLPPFPLDAHGRPIMSYAPLPHSDGSYFTDGTGHTQPVIVSYAVGAHDINATQVRIRFDVGSALRGGESFSVWTPAQGWRLYDIIGVEEDDGEFVCAITPWLRDGFSDGTPIEFDRPRCTMRLAEPKAMDFEFSVNPAPVPDAAFVEYFFDTVD